MLKCPLPVLASIVHTVSHNCLLCGGFNPISFVERKKVILKSQPCQTFRHNITQLHKSIDVLLQFTNQSKNLGPMYVLHNILNGSSKMCYTNEKLAIRCHGGGIST